MWQLFTAHSTYKKRAKFAAIMWTLLIFIACFIPGKDIPNLDIPLLDKWVHFLLFGGFGLLWLLAYPTDQLKHMLVVFSIGALFGWLIEELQGLLSCLGRAKDLLDIEADILGAFLGVLFFYICTKLSKQKSQKDSNKFIP